MALTIAILVSLCSNVSLTQIASKKAELEKQFPDAKVSVRFSKKCEK